MSSSVWPVTVIRYPVRPSAANPSSAIPKKEAIPNKIAIANVELIRYNDTGRRQMGNDWKAPVFREDWEQFTTQEIAKLVSQKVLSLKDIQPKNYDEALNLCRDLASVVIGMNIIIERIGSPRPPEGQSREN